MAGIKTEIVALSDQADYSKSGKMSINGIFDEIYADKFPSSFTKAYVVFTITGAPKFSTQKIHIRIVSPSRKKVLSSEADVPVGANGKGNYFLEVLGMPLESKGKYIVEIVLDSRVIGSTEFDVIAREESEKRKTAN